MSDEEILESLKILKFDYHKHKNLQAALRELLEDENYDQVIRGKPTDPKYLKEVQNIIGAFKALKEVDLETIINVVKESSEELEEDLENQLEEIVIYYDGSYRIMKKNLDTGAYEEIASVNGDINYISSTKMIKKNNGNVIEAYDLLGRFITSAKRVHKITEGIYMTSEEDGTNIKYLDYNGKILFESDDSLYAKNIKIIFFNSNITYKQAKNMLRRAKQYEFLTYYKVKLTPGGLLKATNNGEMAYFNIDGEEIISTKKNGYCYLGDIKLENKDLIIQVAKYDKALNKKYGYYDLKNKKEIIPPKHLYAYPWTCSGLLIDEETPTHVFKTENEIVQVTSENNHPGEYNKLLQRRLRKEYRDSEEIFFEEFKEKNQARFFKEVLAIDRIRQDLYFVKIKWQVFFVKKEKNKWEKCKKTLDLSERRIASDFYRQLGVFVYPYYALKEYGKWCDREILYGFNETGSYLNLLNMLLSSSNEEKTNEIEVSNIKYLESSIFMPKLLDTSDKIKGLLECKSLITQNNGEICSSLMVQDNKDVASALMVLVQNGVLTSRQLEELLPFESTKPKEDSEEIGISASELYDGNPIVITEITSISEDGNILRANFLPFYDGILDRKTKKIIFNTNYEIIELYKNGNFLVKSKSGDVNKLYVLSTQKGTLFGPMDNILDPVNGIYLCSNDGKWYGYDQEGKLTIKESDNIKWVSKYYVNKLGFVIKEEKRLQVTNGGYVFLIDEDGDKLISEPKENLELLSLLEGEETPKLTK